MIRLYLTINEIWLYTVKKKKMCFLIRMVANRIKIIRCFKINSRFQILKIYGFFFLNSIVGIVLSRKNFNFIKIIANFINVHAIKV